ncbi:MAG: hypothetical protein JST26_17585 [Bacteroidetes bacterium]|nr:hypothetical protein [Bacteroidota bacterium]
MKKSVGSVLIFSLLFCLASCQPYSNKANEVLSDAMKASENQPDEPASQTGRLPIQTSVYSNPVKHVPSQEELIKKYRVKSVKQIYKDGWLISNYDKQGHKTGEESDYSGKRILTYEFDKDGRVTKEKTKYKDGSVVTILYTYNPAGQKISRTFTGSDGKSSVIRYEYDTLLNTRTEISDTGRDKEFYDNRGLRVRFESYDEKGKLMGSGEAAYNQDGLKIRESGMIMGLSNNDVFEYNEAGQLYKQHRTGIVDVQFIYEYDDKGLIKTFTTIGGLSAGEDTYEYVFY